MIKKYLGIPVLMATLSLTFSYTKVSAQDRVSFDTSIVYRAVVSNIQSYLIYKFVSANNIHPQNWENIVWATQTFFPDTSEYIELNFNVSNLKWPLELDSNELLIEVQNPLLVLNRSMESFRRYIPDSYTPLLNKSLIVFNKKSQRVSFISGYCFTSNTRYLYDYLLRAFKSKQDAWKEYSKFRFFCYDPRDAYLDEKNDVYCFYSSALDKEICVTVEQIFETY